MEIENFVKSYTSSDFDQIKFDWNGKHGDELKDPNMDFRMRLCEYLVADFSIAPDQLILDLYQELSRSAKETWGVYRNFHLFAQEVLNRGSIKYLMNYLQGAVQSFDTILASGRIELTDDKKKEILAYIKAKQANDQSSENTKYYELALRRFAVN